MFTTAGIIIPIGAKGPNAIPPALTESLTISAGRYDNNDDDYDQSQQEDQTTYN